MKEIHKNKWVQRSGQWFLRVFLPLVLLFSVASCASSCRRSFSSKTDLEMTPRAAFWVARMDLKQFLKMPSGDHLYHLLEQRDFVYQPVKDWISGLSKECGLDVFQRVDTVFMAFPAQLSNEEGYFFSLRGHFNEQEIVSCAETLQKRGKLDQKSVAGVSMYQISQGNKMRFALPMGKDLLLVSSQAHLEKVLSGQLKKEDTLQSNLLLQEMATKQTAQGDVLWFAGLSSGNVHVKAAVDRFGEKGSNIQMLQGALSLKEGVALSLQARFSSAAEAEEKGTAIRSKIEQFRLNNPKVARSKLSAILEKMQIQIHGEELTIRISVGQGDANEALDLINAFTGGPPV